MEIGVVDIGRARLKASIWHQDGRLNEVWSAVAESGGLAAAGDIAGVEAHLRDLVADLKARSGVIVACGGSLLRDPTWRGLVAVADELTDRCFVLTTNEEAALLLRAAVSGGVPADTVLADIGGGSVQLVRGASIATAQVLSWPLGTYAVEDRFGLAFGAQEGAYEKGAQLIRDQLTVEGLGWASNRLTVGSNIMRTFMCRISSRIGAPKAGPWSVNDLDRAWRYCARLPEALFADVFPERPKFMYGADKAMLIAWVIADLVGAGKVDGTNASVSEGLAAVAAASVREGRGAVGIDLD